jgi:hypothetical protein
MLTTIVIAAVGAGAAVALLRSHKRLSDELASTRMFLNRAWSERDAALETVRVLEKANVQLSKAVESYRSEVEPLKALADGLGRQLAAMGKK